MDAVLESHPPSSRREESGLWTLENMAPPAAARATPGELASVWEALVSGRQTVVRCRWEGTSCIMELARSSGPLRQALTPRARAILEEVLWSGEPKAVAYDAELSLPRVAELLKRALAQLGVACLPSQVPLPLVVALHAYRLVPHSAAASTQRAKPARLLAESDEVVSESLWLREISMELEQRLSEAQYRIARARIEGMSHTEIALRYGISPRTVANHLAAVHRKLELGGRLALLALLAHAYLERQGPGLAPSTSGSQPRSAKPWGGLGGLHGVA